MIDFYKHSYISVIGRDASSLSEVAYIKEIMSKYDEYLAKTKEMLNQIGEGYNSNTEFYL